MLRVLKATISSISQLYNRFVSLGFEGLNTLSKEKTNNSLNWALALVTALGATLLFFYPALKNGSLDAGFVYTGDVWNGYLPFTQKLNSVIRNGGFSGIDFSTHGGASDLFLRPNLWAYNPLVLLVSFVVRISSTEQLVRFFVILISVYSFLGCLFTFRLVERYLKLGIGASGFIAVGYTFSVSAVYALGETSFLFSAWLMPAVIYSGLWFREKPGVGRLLVGSIPAFTVLNSGYLPLGMASIMFSVLFLFVFTMVIHQKSNRLSKNILHFASSVSPVVFSLILVLPLYIGYLHYNDLVRTTESTIFFAAHQLSETPHSLFRAFSTYLSATGPFYELTPVFGAIPITIALVFFFGIRKDTGLDIPSERLLLFSFLVYALVVLSIYGGYSVVSDLVFFNIPFVGGMHIYQRHLLAGHFFFMIVISIMLKSVVNSEFSFSQKLGLGISLVVTIVVLAIFNVNPALANTLLLNDFVVFDILCVVLFLMVLLLKSKKIVFVVATFLAMLDPLSVMYNYSTAEGFTFAKQKSQTIMLDSNNSQILLDFFSANSKKDIVKYVDLVSGPPNSFPVNYISPNYPWFVSANKKVSSYGGYDFHLAVMQSYAKTMQWQYVDGRWRMHPDWQWLIKTGADFVIYEEGYQAKDSGIAIYADSSNPDRVLHLPNGIVVAPILKAPNTFNRQNLRGRYVRVQLSRKDYLSLAEVKVMSSNGVNIAQSRPSLQSSNISAEGHAAVAVDGNTDGDWNHGSVTHTKLEQDPWWEVDLGKSQEIRSIEIWNRTDASVGARLSDFWVFVSDVPFGDNDLLSQLQVRKDTASSHIGVTPNPMIEVSASPSQSDSKVIYDNGYFRVLGEKENAKVDSFSTNTTSNLKLNVQSSGVVKVQFLFWPNQRWHFYNNGIEIKAELDGGISEVSLPKGFNRLEMRYQFASVDLFLVLYLLYALAVLAYLIFLISSRLMSLFRPRRPT